MASKKRKHSDTDTGIDAVVPVSPTLQAQVSPEGEAGKKYPEGTVGAFRDFYQTRCIAMGVTYEIEPGLPEFILQKPMDQFEKDESWKIGSFGMVRIYAEKGKGYYSIDSEKAADIDLLCKMIVAGIKGEPKVITLHFATVKSDKLMEDWCKKHDIILKRVYNQPDDPKSKADDKTNPSSDTKPDEASTKNPSSASVKFR